MSIRAFLPSVAFTLLCVSGVASVEAGSVPFYTVLDLGAVEQVNDLNNAGQVVGTFDTSDGEIRAFRTAPNSPINPQTDDLGALGGKSSQPFGMNDLGQVVGIAQRANGGFSGFRTAPNAKINPATDNLDQNLPGSTSAPFDIDQSGRAVGTLLGNNPNFPNLPASFGFRTQPNQPINLDTDIVQQLPGVQEQTVSHTNNAGQVSGFFLSDVSTGDKDAFRTGPNGQSPVGLGSRTNFAAAINNSGVVIGNTDDNQGFRTAPDALFNPLTDLIPPPPGFNSALPLDINNLGDIVGTLVSVNPQQHGGFVMVDQDLVDLNELVLNGTGWNFSAPFAINDLKQIAGVGDFQGAQHGFLLTPSTQSPAVPLPTPLLMGAVGLAALALPKGWRAIRRAGAGVVR